MATKSGNNEIGRSQEEHSEKGLRSDLARETKEPVGNPLTEVNVVEIYHDLFNASWSRQAVDPAVANADI